MVHLMDWLRVSSDPSWPKLLRQPSGSCRMVKSFGIGSHPDRKPPGCDCRSRAAGPTSARTVSERQSARQQMGSNRRTRLGGPAWLPISRVAAQLRSKYTAKGHQDGQSQHQDSLKPLGTRLALITGI